MKGREEERSRERIIANLGNKKRDIIIDITDIKK